LTRNSLEEFVSIDNAEVLGGKAFDFSELERVDRGLLQAAVDEVDVVDHDGEDDAWDEASLMSSVGHVVDGEFSPLELCHSAGPGYSAGSAGATNLCPQHYD
jgi:hypothetical protein